MSAVSVLLPFRNAEATLHEAIASIQAQTFLDRELLLIDNASTDRSVDIARSWCGQDPRIRMIAEPDIGIAHALNTGLSHAQGQLIARMDADDLAHPGSWRSRSRSCRPIRRSACSAPAQRSPPPWKKAAACAGFVGLAECDPHPARALREALRGCTAGTPYGVVPPHARGAAWRLRHGAAPGGS